MTARDAGLGLAVGLFAFLPFYALRKMGAGDVKLLAVLGWMTGLKGLLASVLIGSLLSGVWALLAVGVGANGGLSLFAWRLGRTRVAQRLAQWRGARQGIPYGACLACGTLAWRFLT